MSAYFLNKRNTAPPGRPASVAGLGSRSQASTSSGNPRKISRRRAASRQVTSSSAPPTRRTRAYSRATARAAPPPSDAQSTASTHALSKITDAPPSPSGSFVASQRS